MSDRTQRFYVDAHIGNQIARFPQTTPASPRGIGTLAAVSGGLFQRRAQSSRSVIEQLSRVVIRTTFTKAA